MRVVTDANVSQSVYRLVLRINRLLEATFGSLNWFGIGRRAEEKLDATVDEGPIRSGVKARVEATVRV
jgi:hypothetical protein